MLTAPRIFFGIHSFSPYSRTTGEFYGTARVIGGSSLSLSGELINLNGGSSKYPYASEDGAITAEMTLKVKEYPDFLFELFLGSVPTDNVAEASGSVTTIANKSGTSIVSATVGIASVTAKSASEADLKFGKYVVKATGAATVDVYFSSDADIGRGTDGEFQNDLLKITAAALTVPGTGGTVDVPNFGLKITGGSSSIAFETGDTATFEVKPINTGSMDVVVGSVADQIFPEFGAIVMGQKRSNQEMVEVDCYRCKSAGMPINFEENAFSESEIKINLLYDSVLDGLFKMRTVKPS